MDRSAAHVRFEGLLESEAKSLATVYAFELTSDKLTCSK